MTFFWYGKNITKYVFTISCKYLKKKNTFGTPVFKSTYIGNSRYWKGKWGTITCAFRIFKITFRMHMQINISDANICYRLLSSGKKCVLIYTQLCALNTDHWPTAVSARMYIILSRLLFSSIFKVFIINFYTPVKDWMHYGMTLCPSIRWNLVTITLHINGFNSNCR